MALAPCVVPLTIGLSATVSGGSFDDTDPNPMRDHVRRAHGPDHGLPGLEMRRPTDIELFQEDPALKARKRPRHRPEIPRTVDNDEPIRISVSKIGLRIGDAQALWDFYEQRFKNCQQTACKLIAKAWVKAVEPKKQSAHPYTGSDEKAPTWWPKPWGSTETERVRHKEPDHLLKKGMMRCDIPTLRMSLQS